MRFVLDSSFATKWFVEEEYSTAAMMLLEAGAEFVAPDILLVETASALLRKERRGEIPFGRANNALLELDQLGCELVPHRPLLKRAAALSTTWRHGVLDCLYLIVAQDRRLPLATFDGPMASLAQRLSITLWAAQDTAP